MKLSRYETIRLEAIKVLHRAICENNYFCKDEYLIIIENVTDGYNVDFTHTDNPDWADTVFDQSCDIMTGCAFSHNKTHYYTILAKSYQSGEVVLIKEDNLYIK